LRELATALLSRRSKPDLVMLGRGRGSSEVPRRPVFKVLGKRRAKKKRRMRRSSLKMELHQATARANREVGSMWK
jgi:hypothetical protein